MRISLLHVKNAAQRFQSATQKFLFPDTFNLQKFKWNDAYSKLNSYRILNVVGTLELAKFLSKVSISKVMMLELCKYIRLKKKKTQKKLVQTFFVLRIYVLVFQNVNLKPQNSLVSSNLNMDVFLGAKVNCYLYPSGLFFSVVVNDF